MSTSEIVGASAKKSGRPLAARPVAIRDAILELPATYEVKVVEAEEREFFARLVEGMS